MPKLDQTTLAPALPGNCSTCSLLPAAFYCDGSDGCAAIIERLRRGQRGVRAKRSIYREGDVAQEIYVLYDGWAFRYKLLHSGQRQILSFLLPGDPISFPLLHLDRVNFSVRSLTAVTLCIFRRSEMSDYIAARPQLAKQAELICVQAMAATEERLVDLGRRSAYERVGKLILELVDRLHAKGLSDRKEAPFPLGQLHIADALGLTSVHVGRVLRQFRANGVLSLHRGRLTIHDPEALAQL